MFKTSNGEKLPEICDIGKNNESKEKESSQKKIEVNSTQEKSEGGLSKSGLLTGILYGCLKPVCGLFTAKEKPEKDPWLIAFNELTEIRLIGSGAQGAVFLGHFRNEEVAIKKVKNERDTDIRHLRHFDHKNIVKFR